MENIISGKTRITGLFGYPVEHSLSPRMHNAGFKKLGLDYRYIGLLVHPDKLGQAVEGIRAMNFAGVNVTIPHKEKVLDFLDEIDKEAKFIGAVNTIINKEGVLKGYNTDGRGFMKSLEEKGIQADDKKVFVIGAGGASRAVSYYLGGKARNVGIFDIDIKKLELLVNDLQKEFSNVTQEEDLTKVKDSDIILNATPLGMKPGEPLPVDISFLKPDQVVCDLIYKDTPLLQEAQKLGCTTLNGLGMLLWQGILAFEIWTGKEAPVQVMKEALIQGFQK